MSYHLPPPIPSSPYRRQRPYGQDIQQKPTYANYDSRSMFSSSPPPSSSPPSTPYMSRHAHGHAYIRSSPPFGIDAGVIGGASEHLEDPQASSWNRRNPIDAPAYNKHSSTSYIPNFRSSSVLINKDYPPSSDIDASEFSEDLDRDIPDVDSELASDSAPGHGSSGVFSDSEEEDEVSPAPVDVEDEEPDMFGYGYRRTFFRTSAERGQWKSDPMPFRPAPIPLLQTRKSAPTLSRVPTPTLVNPTRTISEPAPSSVTLKTSFIPTEPLVQLQDEPDHTIPEEDTASASSQPVVISSESPTPSELESPQTLPSLTSDRESSPDADIDEHEMMIPSSPLPPSSPPPISPMSRSVSILSPLSSPSSMAYDRSSSPLSEVPDDFELDGPLVQEEPKEETESSTEVKSRSALDSLQKPGVSVDGVLPTRSLSEPPSVLDSLVASTSEPRQQLPAHQDEEQPRLSAPPSSESKFILATSESDSEPVLPTESRSKVSRKELHLHPMDLPALTNSGPVMTMVSPSEAHVADSMHVKSGGDAETSAVDVMMESDVKAELPLAMSSAPSSAASPSAVSDDVYMEVDHDEVVVKSKDQVPNEKGSKGTLKDRHGELQRHTSESAESSSSKSSSKTRKEDKVKGKRPKEVGGEAPAKKKRKIETEVERQSLIGDSDEKLERTEGKRKAHADEDIENDGCSEATSTAPKPRKRKRAEAAAPAASTTTTKRASKSNRRARASSSYPEDSDSEDLYNEPLDPDAKTLHSTICGMAIETMAMSRASSLPVSSIYKLVMREQPALKAQRTDKEWSRIFERVLRDGEASRGSGVFGKVESSGKDDSDRPLEAQWFYVPELDEDQERAALIRSMMPRPAKRSETKKYKQYYWRPLDKISRWDPEDEL